VLPVDATERLTAAVETILAPETEHDDTPAETDSVAPEPESAIPPALERLARAEPLAASQEAVVEVMEAQPVVVGWRRQLDADPCQLCSWWWANGRIYRTTVKFQKHPNCNCQPEPVIEGETA